LKKVYELDGRRFSTLEEFAQHFSEVVLSDYQWTGNLNAFNDVLRGGFGTPDGGYVVRWLHSDLSRARLGYEETVRQLERQLVKCHPSNRDSFRERIAAARTETGQTVFDWLVEIIQVHCEGGEEAEDMVVLELV